MLLDNLTEVSALQSSGALSCSRCVEQQTPGDKGKGRSPDMPPQGTDTPSHGESADEDEDDACGFCRYMKGGGCKKEFKVCSALPAKAVTAKVHTAYVQHRRACMRAW